jgi:hypothetical protein
LPSLPGRVGHYHPQQTCMRLRSSTSRHKADVVYMGRSSPAAACPALQVTSNVVCTLGGD